MTEEMLLICLGLVIGLAISLGLIVVVLWLADWAHERKLRKQREHEYLVKLDQELEAREHGDWDFPKPKMTWDGTKYVSNRTKPR